MMKPSVHLLQLPDVAHELLHIVGNASHVLITPRVPVHSRSASH